MNILTAFEIANNYPDQIQLLTAQDEKTGKHALFMYRLKGKDIHKLMMSSEPNFETAEAAIELGKSVCESAIQWVNRSSVWPHFKLTI